MGYSTRPNSEITDFWPDDTDTEIYISSETMPTLAELQEKIDEKWPGASAANVTISSEKIHTNCLYYNRYDAGDYTNFIIITRSKGA